MWPVLHHGDMVLAVSTQITKKPSRGDIVIFNDVNEEPWIKQVIGLPKETIRIARRRILIDGEPLRRFKPDVEMTYRFGPVTIPDAHYFMLGLNVEAGEDSRHFGPVPEERILYRPLCIYRPFGRFDIFIKWWARDIGVKMLKLPVDLMLRLFCRNG